MSQAMEKRTLAVIGSRGYPVDDIGYILAEYAGGCDRIVSGGARGVDRTAEEWAAGHGLSVVSYRPKRSSVGYVVEKFVDGQSAGIVPVPSDTSPWTFVDFPTAAKRRNWWIVRDASRVIAFWDGISSGTAHGIAAATRLHRELRIWMDGDS